MGQDPQDNSKKRAREDKSADSSDHKLARVDSYNPVFNSDNADSGVNSPDAKRIQDDLFSILDESDEPMIQGLDSVIKSFEEEILVPVIDNDTVDTSGCRSGSQPDLGYLLEASDDELGLPPTFPGEEEKVNPVNLAGERKAETDMAGSGADGSLGEILGFENEISSYDAFEFGFGGDPVNISYNDSGDFVALGGLFDYSDENYVPSDISGVQWQPESLSAL
ncbi:uncharacterized protein LOC8268650 [Ricinus communis]|uniref:Uncharacterized protein n=1 Tax=Ricinus communis TaxID=3988 RepID=B9T328_RICCO|nr:uncharacterized protein LOC8268650 [Ricinus communis]EEF29720.1 conserved hypothetical protein [Ricinus communis]|eukprot:XP_002532647.1 uncharacterized protein LOC8268650 [Ricinus communis]